MPNWQAKIGFLRLKSVFLAIRGSNFKQQGYKWYQTSYFCPTHMFWGFKIESLSMSIKLTPSPWGGLTNGRMDGRTDSPCILQDFIPSVSLRGRCPKNKQKKNNGIRWTGLVRQGKELPDSQTVEFELRIADLKAQKSLQWTYNQLEDADLLCSTID